jgi:hypothetical protein
VRTRSVVASRRGAPLAVLASRSANESLPLIHPIIVDGFDSRHPILALFKIFYWYEFVALQALLKII